MSAALAVAAVLAAGLAMRVLIRALPLVRDRAPAGPAAADESGDLANMQRRVATGTAHAGELHLRLRPVLREIAAEGLRRRGVDLYDEPERARELLSDETWEVVRPDRPRPENPFAPGLAPRRLDTVLDDLEVLLR